MNPNPRSSAATELQDEATRLDAADPLSAFREAFYYPSGKTGAPQCYLCGHSLGLMPRQAQELVEAELKTWREHGVAGHFAGDAPWMPYHELVREPLARLVGAMPEEVVAMNSLTVNLHLLCASFFRPETQRHKILIEKHAFPSDRYAMASQLHWHGLDPQRDLIELEDEENRACLSPATLERCLARHQGEIALVLLPGVQYLSGQWLELPELTRIAQEAGAMVGVDCAHAAGNVPLQLHDDNVDFAVWCSYKYLNSGPGAVGGAFVHERHHADPPARLEGWWGHRRSDRFEMPHDFRPAMGADAWSLSNPPILALAPLRAALALFDDAGIKALHAKALTLTDYARRAIDALCGDAVEVLTPERRGAQLSLRLRSDPRSTVAALEQADVVIDFREPDVVRAAGAPLYTRFADMLQLAEALAA